MSTAILISIFGNINVPSSKQWSQTLIDLLLPVSYFIGANGQKYRTFWQFSSQNHPNSNNRKGRKGSRSLLRLEM
jgi:hypothetical protein